MGTAQDIRAVISHYYRNGVAQWSKVSARNTREEVNLLQNVSILLYWITPRNEFMPRTYKWLFVPIRLISMTAPHYFQHRAGTRFNWHPIPFPIYLSQLDVSFIFIHNIYARLYTSQKALAKCQSLIINIYHIEVLC